MIHNYSIRLQGESHKKNNTPCQDAFAVKNCGEDIVIAVVGDGLGSAEYSDVASQIAVEISANYCAEHITQQSGADGIIQTIRASFDEAQFKIEEKVKSEGHDLPQYHTTLSLAALVGDILYYGHAGDSGIVALTLEGRFEKVTEQQRDKDGNVFPLSFDSKWMFGQFAPKVCSVLLATDGMLLRLFPLLLRNEPVNIRVNEAGFLMDNRRLHIDTRGTETVETEIENYIKNIPPEDVANDDVTITVLVNTSVKPGTLSVDYYKEPNWTELIRQRDDEFEREAYPHKFENNKSPTCTVTGQTDKAEKNSDGKTVSPDDVSVNNKTAPINSETLETNATESEIKPPVKKGWINRLLGGK